MSSLRFNFKTQKEELWNSKIKILRLISFQNWTIQQFMAWNWMGNGWTKIILTRGRWTWPVLVGGASQSNADLLFRHQWRLQKEGPGKDFLQVWTPERDMASLLCSILCIHQLWVKGRHGGKNRTLIWFKNYENIQFLLLVVCCQKNWWGEGCRKED